MNNVMYSTCEDAERLYHWDPADAAGEAINDGADYPIRVYAWRRRVLSAAEIKSLADSMIEGLINHWNDQDWADPEDSHDIQPEFEKALRDLCASHLPNEHVWGGERAPGLDVVIIGDAEGGSICAHEDGE